MEITSGRDGRGTARWSVPRTLAIVAAATAFGMAIPVGAWGATGSLMNIVDPTNSARKARVSAEGRLLTLPCDSDSCTNIDSGKVRVGDGSGALTVDGTVSVPRRTTVSVFEAVIGSWDGYATGALDVSAMDMVRVDVGNQTPNTCDVWVDVDGYRVKSFSLGGYGSGGAEDSVSLDVPGRYLYVTSNSCQAAVIVMGR